MTTHNKMCTFFMGMITAGVHGVMWRMVVSSYCSQVRFFSLRTLKIIS